MIKRALICALLLASPVLMGASGQAVIDGWLEPAGYTQIADVSGAVGLGTVPAGTRLTLIQAEAQAVRWRDDGVEPTASVGMLLSAGQTLVYNGNPTAIKVIETTATAAVNVTFYR